MSFKIITPLQTQAYETLKRMLLEDRFLPDNVYSERRISEELGISRTPLRDAIHRLAQEGYIDVIPSKGFQLHKMTSEDLSHTYEIRCALEGFCVVRIARAHGLPETKQVLHILESLIVDQKRIVKTSRDINAFAAYDMEFHKRIVYFANNPLFSDTYEAYRYNMHTQTLASLKNEGRLEATVIEHEAILNFMKAGDEWGSYNAAVQHIGMAQTLIEITNNNITGRD